MAISSCPQSCSVPPVGLRSLVVWFLLVACFPAMVLVGDAETIVWCNTADAAAHGATVVSVFDMQSHSTYTLTDCDAAVSLRSSASMTSNISVVVKGGTVMPSVRLTGQSIADISFTVEDLRASPTSVRSSVDWFYFVTSKDKDSVTRNISIVFRRVYVRSYTGSVVRLKTHIADGLTFIAEDCDIDLATTRNGLVDIEGSESDGAQLSNLHMRQTGGTWKLSVSPSGRAMGYWIVHGFSDVAHITMMWFNTSCFVSMTHSIAVGSSGTKADRYTIQSVEVPDPATARHITILNDLVHFVSEMEMDVSKEDAVVDLRFAYVYTFSSSDNPIVFVENVQMALTNSNLAAHSSNQGFFLELRSFLRATNVSVFAENVSLSMLAHGESGDSARSAILLALISCELVENVDAHVNAVQLTSTLHRGIKLEEYVASTSTFFLLQRTVISNLSVSIHRCSLDVTVDEGSKARVIPLLGTEHAFAQFAVTIAHVVFLSSPATGVVVHITHTHLHAQGNVYGPLMPVGMNVIVDYLVVAIAAVTIQTNCTDCSIRLDYCHVASSELFILPPVGTSIAPITEAIECAQYCALNMSSFVTGIDSSLIMVKCLGDIFEQLKFFPGEKPQQLNDISLDPMQHTNFVLRVNNSVISTQPREVSHPDVKSMSVSIYGPPRLWSNSTFVLSNIVFTSRFTASSLLVFAQTKASNVVVLANNISGLQSCVETRIFEAHIAYFSLRMVACRFIQHPFRSMALFDTTRLIFERPWPTLSTAPPPPLVTSSELSVDRCAFEDGVIGIFGPLADISNMPQRSIHLGCNTWGGNETTASFYRTVAFATSNRSLSFDANMAKYNLSTACAGPPTPAPVTHAPVPPTPAPVASPGASAAGVAAMGIASSIPTISAAPSLVRLQTSMLALNIRNNCNGTVTFGESMFENPTGVTVPALGADYQHAGGTVLMNAMLVTGVGVASALGRIAPKMWKHREQLGILSQKSKARLWLRYLPGSGVVLYAVFLQPTVTSAVALLASGIGEAVVIGLCGVVYFLGLLGFVCLRVLRNFPLTFTVDRKPTEGGDGLLSSTQSVPRDPSARSCRSLLTSLWTSFAISAGDWKASRRRLAGSKRLSSPAGGQPISTQEFLFRYSPLFETFRGGRHWFFAIELSIAALCGVLCGLSGAIPCDTVLWALVGLCGVGLLCSIVARPCATPMDNIIVMSVNALGFVACVTIALSMDEIAENVSIAQIVISLMAAMVDAAKWFLTIFFRRNSRHRLRKKAEEQIRAAFGDPRDVSQQRYSNSQRMRNMFRPFSQARSVAEHIMDGVRGHDPATSLEILLHRICDAQNIPMPTVREPSAHHRSHADRRGMQFASAPARLRINAPPLVPPPSISQYRHNFDDI